MQRVLENSVPDVILLLLCNGSFEKSRVENVG